MDRHLDSHSEGAPTAPALEDFYVENGLLVFTAAYHLKRGYCCNSGCRHCPFPSQPLSPEAAPAAIP